MIDIEAKRKEIEEKWQPCVEACSSLQKALTELRSISLDDIDRDKAEELQQAIALGRDIDNRTNYILRSILVQHGNVLFL